jgi:hypothetical protein
LWIRCPAGMGCPDDRAGGGALDRALKAADLVVAAGGFGLVALDLGEARGRVPTAAWIRLKHAAERQGTAVVVATAWRVVGPFAAAAIALSTAEGPRFLPGGGPPLFAALHVQAERLRGARGRWRGPAALAPAMKEERCAWLAFSSRS